ncbi:SDR family NAD(P)-dependent oxidoreductase [Aeromicrobium wangtongii]|uniref:SDR family oxidoreductase n=1 Tax=Aeromicrobium wangtongii TaxID=2969247 RepID=A0ABY5MCF5_9ACTN|nr:SDR family NAD(P)-dependent oxidoreductase [Aeromicrobium wangtongii]MCD9197169.1 SDR family oxidoreductase [Aeromicrobium wangtongii]UUP14665.1 SDR family oxidoreductase [Aeromicrobium wangtongii]
MTALTDKVIVVTGCTQGFGRVLVGLVAARGARLVISGPWPDEAEEQAADLRARGVDAVATGCDVTVADQVESLADLAVATYGRIDIWVNNAAASTPVGRAFDLDPGEFRRAIEVNALGTFHGTRAAVTRMLDTGGVVVNILGRGDNAGPTPYTTAYGATKAWVAGFTSSVRKEYADSGVQLVGFNPGMMLTDKLTGARAVGEAGERMMKPFAKVQAVFADPPEVAAERLVAVLEKDRPPAKVNLLGPVGASRHAVRYAARAVRGVKAR